MAFARPPRFYFLQNGAVLFIYLFVYLFIYLLSYDIADLFSCCSVCFLSVRCVFEIFIVFRPIITKQG